MKKKLLMAVPLMLILVALGWWVYFHSGLVQYPIFWAYQFPSEAELEKIEDYEDKVQACAIPQKTIDKMTTGALLQSFLNYPLAQNPLDLLTSNTAYHFWLENLKTQHQVGVDALLAREDLCNAILKCYRKIPLYKNSIDEKLSWNDKKVLYANQYKNVEHMVSLEVLSALMDIGGDGADQAALREELERKYNEKKQYQFYDGPPYTSIYFFAAQMEQNRKQMETREINK